MFGILDVSGGLGRGSLGGIIKRKKETHQQKNNVYFFRGVREGREERHQTEGFVARNNSECIIFSSLMSP